MEMCQVLALFYHLFGGLAPSYNYYGSQPPLLCIVPFATFLLVCAYYYIFAIVFPLREHTIICCFGVICVGARAQGGDHSTKTGVAKMVPSKLIIGLLQNSPQNALFEKPRA